jgi:hypothetical protein
LTVQRWRPTARRESWAIGVTVAWGVGPQAFTLATAMVGKGGGYVLGEEAGCDLAVPAELLGATRVQVITWANEPALQPPTGAQISVDGVESDPSALVALAPGSLVVARFGGLVVTAILGHRESLPTKHDPRRHLRPAAALLASAVSHAICFAVFVLLQETQTRDPSAEQVRIMRHLLEAGAQRARVEVEALPMRPRLSGEEPTSPPKPLRGAAAAAPPNVVRRELPAARPAHEGPEPSGAAREMDAPRPAGTGEGDGVVNVEDVGGLLASLKRRPKLPGGFAHVPDRGGPEASLRPPYPITSDGRLDKNEIVRVVGAMTGRMRACANEGLQRAPGDSGRVAITVRVGRAGEVVGAEDAGGDVQDMALRACIAKTFQELHFSAPERGSATFTFPVRVGPLEIR